MVETLLHRELNPGHLQRYSSPHPGHSQTHPSVPPFHAHHQLSNLPRPRPIPYVTTPFQRHLSVHWRPRTTPHITTPRLHPNPPYTCPNTLIAKSRPRQSQLIIAPRPRPPYTCPYTLIAISRSHQTLVITVDRPRPPHTRLNTRSSLCTSQVKLYSSLHLDHACSLTH